MALGIWEATAFVTGRVPTVSCTYARWRRRHPRLAQLALLAWLVSLALHLHRHEVT